MNSRFNALILCGGKGTRLGQLGKKMPKSLVIIDKNPILKELIKFIFLK